MRFFNRLSIGVKLPLIGVLAALIPSICLMGALLWQNARVSATADPEFERLAMTDLSHIADGVYALCRTQQDLLSQKVASDLKTANEILATDGGISLSGESTTWDAVNQLSQATTQVELPVLRLGGDAITVNASFSEPSPLVDDVREITSSTCTIFQRMNAGGDMFGHQRDHVSARHQQRQLRRNL
jgi:methyl-accepting chemotaxis protein